MDTAYICLYRTFNHWGIIGVTEYILLNLPQIPKLYCSGLNLTLKKKKVPAVQELKSENILQSPV